MFLGANLGLAALVFGRRTLIPITYRDVIYVTKYGALFGLFTCISFPFSYVFLLSHGIRCLYDPAHYYAIMKYGQFLK